MLLNTTIVNENYGLGDWVTIIFVQQPGTRKKTKKRRPTEYAQQVFAYWVEFVLFWFSKTWAQIQHTGFKVTSMWLFPIEINPAKLNIFNIIVAMQHSNSTNVRSRQMIGWWRKANENYEGKHIVILWNEHQNSNWTGRVISHINDYSNPCIGFITRMIER